MPHPLVLTPPCRRTGASVALLGAALLLAAPAPARAQSPGGDEPTPADASTSPDAATVPSDTTAADAPAVSDADEAAAPTSEIELPPGLTPPRLLEQPPPVFPDEALAADTEADVIVQLDVDETGAVTAVVPTGLTVFTYDANGDVVETPTALTEDTYGFVAAALEVAQSYRFSPAIVVDETSPQGRPVPVQLTWRVGFVIDWEAIDAAREAEAAAAAAAAAAQPGGLQIDESGPVNFEGVLLERGTREPLRLFVVRASLDPDPEVAGDELATTTMTDESGRFAFRGLPPGNWSVRIDEAGYFTFETTEQVVFNEVTDATYYVEANAYGEYVSTTTASPPRREVTRRTIQAAEIQRVAGNNGDAIRVVQNLPGVARPAFGGGAVIVRGSAPEDTGFYLDGMPIPALYHFGGLRAVFPTELLEEINFYPGGFSAQYGRATGGILEVTTQTRIPDRLRGHVDMNLFDTGVFLQGPITDTLAFQLGARRSYIDAILAPLADTFELSFATAPRYYDWQGRLLWKINADHTASMLIYGSNDLIDVVQEDESQLEPGLRGGIRATSFFTGLQLRLDSQLTDTLRNDFRIQVNNQGLGFSLGTDIYFDLETLQHSYRDTLTWTPNERYTLRYGLDIEVTPGQIAVRAPRPPKEGEEGVGFQASEIVEIDQTVRYYDPAHFIEAEIEPLEGLRLIPGFRMEWYRVPGQWAYNPRGAVRYNVTDALVIKGAAGLFQQPPAPDETGFGFGNPDLLLERAVHYVAGTEYAITDYLQANVEFFYKDLDNLVTRSNNTVERNGQIVPELFNNDAIGRVYGAEVLIRHDLNNRFFGWIAYTFSRSERQDAPGEEWRLFDFDQTHILTLVGSYNLPRNWSIGTRFRLVSGNPTTPLEEGVFDASSYTYVRVAGEQNSIRQPLFHQLDLRVDKRWIYDRITFNAYLDLQNVYNQGNQESVAYSYDFTDQANITGLPFIPSFGLRVEF